MIAISAFVLIQTAVEFDVVNSPGPNKPQHKYSLTIVPLLRNSLSLL